MTPTRSIAEARLQSFPRSAAIPAAAGAAAFLFYAAFVPRFAGDFDAAEFTLAIAVAGAPHPTGYPWYVLGGYLFGQLFQPFGAPWPWIANLWSAAGAAVAVGGWVALAGRLLPGAGSRAVALASALVLAAHPVWMEAALVAEVHSWGLAWLMVLALVGSRTLSRLDQDAAERTAAALPERRLDPRWIGLAWGVLVGLGLSHHATSVFYAGPLTLALGWAAWRARVRAVPALPLFALGVVVGLLPDAWILHRAFHPAAVQWPQLEPTLRSVVDHLTGSFYRMYLGAFLPDPTEADRLARTIYPIVLPGLAALALLLPRIHDLAVRALLIGLVIGSAAQLVFVLHYGVPDPSAYFLPALAVSLLAVPLLVARLPANRMRQRTVLVAAGVALVATAILAPREAARIRQQVEILEGDARAAWRAIPFERAIVLWRSDLYYRLLYYQVIEREYPERVVENPIVLMYPPRRRAFMERMGFDPLAGLTIRVEPDLAAVPRNAQRQTSIPVIDFDRVFDRVSARRAAARDGR